ncbi:hypothetical protein [Isoptericola croceus]|uniref:restriction system modified-DNA reader domain-containing protein n=1 Tax=Isoptericola croceus TaxID=3031406 RepID=UPI0023F98B5C|nr:hypothetical protein [Isoptericola croceus]
MPLFEVDASRPLLVQSGRSAGAVEPGLGTTAHRVVDSHIDGLLGEQIFPVAQGVGPDEPHLLALDATGSPVVVELVSELDRPALTRSLDHAGWAGRLTRGELASRYHGGPNAFQRDVAAFYDSVPITRSQPGRSSARLIIICQEAGEEILNAVDFLRQPTMPVEVLKMGVVHSQDGRRFVDVSPLVIHPASTPAAPRLSAAVPQEELHGTSASRGAEPESFAEGVQVGIALTGKQPAVAQPGGTGSPDPARGAAPSRSARSRTDAARDTAEQAPAQRTRAGRRAAAGASSLSLPAVRAELPQDPPAPARRAPAPPPPPPAPEPAPPRRRSRRDRFTSQPPQPTPELAAFTAASAGSAEDLDLAELARRTTTSAASTDTPGLGEDFARYTAPALDLPAPRVESAASRREPAPWDPPANRWEDPLNDPAPYRSSGWEPSTPNSWTNASDDLPRLEVPPLEAPSYTPPPDHGLYDTAERPPVGFEDEVDGDLIALAATLHRPTMLVWSRPRRRQYFEAVLHPNGVIELSDGSRFQHPDHAASAASGTPTDDGWNVWHLGPDGPSLLDAYRARFA